MCASEKQAWFSLAVILLTMLAVAALYPMIGWRAHGALGLLGLLGLEPVFYRKQKSEAVIDERTIQIQQRSALLAFSIFWVVFVLIAALVTPLVYTQAGSVPVSVIQISVFYALLLFMGTKSLATLIQHKRG